MDRVSLIAVAVVAMLAPAAAAEEPGPSWLDKLRRSQEAVEWSDVAVRHDWRLQERPRDGRFRILDPRDDMVRQGSAEACRAAFAGFAADGSGFSPLLDGDDDAVVRVEETRLDGAGDFLLVPVHHEALLRDQRVKQATESFLKSGRFAADRDEAVP